MLKVAVQLNWRPLSSLSLICFTHRKLHTLNPNLRFPTSKFFCSAVAQTSPSLNGDLDTYLRCSMPQKPHRVAVLVSGGVDSSVALRLLHAAGHSCTAFYLKIWFQVRLPSFHSPNANSTISDTLFRFQITVIGIRGFFVGRL